MKQNDIVQVIAKDLGTTDVAELNKLLKAKNYKATKYRIAGKAIGHFGFTGVIKNITEEGLKVFEATRVRLIKFSDMEIFEQAKPRVERPKGPKPDSKLTAKKNPKASRSSNDDEDDEFDEDDGDDDQEGDVFIEEEPAAKKNDKKHDKKKKDSRRLSPTGSRFIPGK